MNGYAVNGADINGSIIARSVDDLGFTGHNYFTVSIDNIGHHLISFAATLRDGLPTYLSVTIPMQDKDMNYFDPHINPDPGPPGNPNQRSPVVLTHLTVAQDGRNRSTVIVAARITAARAQKDASRHVFLVTAYENRTTTRSRVIDFESAFEVTMDNSGKRRVRCPFDPRMRPGYVARFPGMDDIIVRAIHLTGTTQSVTCSMVER